MLRRIIIQILLVVFVVSCLGPISAQAHGETIHESLLPAPGTMVSLSAAYQPAIIRGITVHKDNPFLFDFIVDVGQDKLNGDVLKEEGQKLIKYFLASLAVPEKDLWVNLSPFEKDRIIPKALGQTDMGRDLLAQDYMLKQITASLIYPEKSLGKEFWNRIYAKAGNVQIPVNVFNKVWIMADKAEVFEKGQTAFVVSCHLKVMLEEDYLALTKNTVGVGSKPTLKRAGYEPAPTKDTSQIIRDLILPELEREVNEGKNFANLRQICHSIILASWYKKNLKQALLNQVYSNQSKIQGIDLEDRNIKEKIYSQYLQAYKKGVFNYIKDTDTPNGVSGPRKYFSGGFISSAMMSNPRIFKGSFSQQAIDIGSLQNFSVELKVNAAMAVEKDKAAQTLLGINPAMTIEVKPNIKLVQERLGLGRNRVILKPSLPQGTIGRWGEFVYFQRRNGKKFIFATRYKRDDLIKVSQFILKPEKFGKVSRDGIRRGLSIYYGNADAEMKKFLNTYTGDTIIFSEIHYAIAMEFNLYSSDYYKQGTDGVTRQEFYVRYDNDDKRLLTDLNYQELERNVRLWLKALIDQVKQGSEASPAMASPEGGIDLRNAAVNSRSNGPGVQMKVDQAMIERVKREGIEQLRLEILSVSPIKSLDF